MNRKTFVFTLAMLMILLTSAGEVLAFPSFSLSSNEEPGRSALSPLSSGFAYQGQLALNGDLVTGLCDFKFLLWDANTGGAQVGAAQTIDNVDVKDGLFTVQIDFGNGPFSGDARWLAVAVRCPAGSGDYTSLEPRQALTAAPYAFALPGLWTQPNTTSTNLIGGFSGNEMGAGVIGGTIGGGGKSGAINQVTGAFGVVAGGRENAAEGLLAVVGGGELNIAGGDHSVIAGGVSNNAAQDSATIAGGSGNAANGSYSTIGGGNSLYADGYATTLSGGEQNTAFGDYGTVGGGNLNHAYGNYSLVAGGNGNTANSFAGTIGGGAANYVDYDYATIAGGHWNRVEAPLGTIGGGGYGDPADRNLVTDEGGTIGGGGSNLVGTDDGNLTNAYYATVSGGWDNTAGNQYVTVGGGQGNTASGVAATIPGGWQNVAAGDYSFAAGCQAQATYAGSFVWADSLNCTPFASQHAHQFRVRAYGGAQFDDDVGNWVELNWNQPIDTSTGAYLSWGGTWTNASDANLKENFTVVDNREILETLAKMPLYAWNYKAEDADTVHLGPTAQDFSAAFGLGNSDTAISTVDADGVSLAAIQGLYHLSLEQAAQIESLQSKNDELEARLTALEQASGQSSTPSKEALNWMPFSGLIFAAWVIERRRHTKSNASEITGRK